MSWVVNWLTILEAPLHLGALDVLEVCIGVLSMAAHRATLGSRSRLENSPTWCAVGAVPRPHPRCVAWQQRMRGRWDVAPCLASHAAEQLEWPSSMPCPPCPWTD
jgi:hypothetical protein